MRAAQRAGALLAIVALGWAEAAAQVAPRVESFHPDSVVPMSDFSGLEGVWSVESRSLVDRLAADQVWLLNTMETRFQVLLGGLVVINNTWGTFNDVSMDAIMIRTHDPDLNEWRFQWMSSVYPHLTEQVRGRFENGVGAFHGTEAYGDERFPMRFRWKRLSDDHYFWEQAYQIGDGWRPNWTLEFRRIDGEVAGR